jgi:hypothetical protein
MGFEIGDSYMQKESIILTQHLELRKKEYENKMLYDGPIYGWTYSVIRTWPENSWGTKHG